MQNGGARPGAGRPAGQKMQKTLEKEAAREFVRQMVTDNLAPMLKAQIAHASGVQHFFLRDPSTGQFKRITDPDEIEAALNAPNAGEGSTYWIFSKDPNVQAFTDLLNRALDKPTEQVHVTGDGSPIVIQWLSPAMNSTVVHVTPEEGGIDDKIRHARKVNGHVESSGATDGESND